MGALAGTAVSLCGVPTTLMLMWHLKWWHNYECCSTSSLWQMLGWQLPTFPGILNKTFQFVFSSWTNDHERVGPCFFPPGTLVGLWLHTTPHFYHRLTIWVVYFVWVQWVQRYPDGRTNLKDRLTECLVVYVGIIFLMLKLEQVVVGGNSCCFTKAIDCIYISREKALKL